MNISTHLILTLSESPGIGTKSLNRILDTLSYKIEDNLDELRALLEEAKKKHTRIRIPNEEDLDKAYKKANKIISDCESSNIKIISCLDKRYPNRYLELCSDKPVILFVKGDIDCLHEDLSVAIIGTRNPTKWGLGKAISLAESLVSQGFTIVSGLAKGCDTAGHQGSLHKNGKTVAILPSGINCIYPKENIGLAEKIIEGGGCLLSEYPPNSEPKKNYFIDRDRLQSSLSQGIIVIETDIKGGTMHTVEFAQKQKKIIGCLSGHPIEFRGKSTNGTDMLIKEGIAKEIKDNKASLSNFIDILKNQESKNQVLKTNKKGEQLKLKIWEE